ncbi:MAG: protein-L-isoaspartate(D-aspartate) O-methyltransferase [Candidatus Hydrogenedentes bacterium]|nr:protein-L-isoaspartate(D-aspartate) O-methyltransferase [Candidatus Hydrogenedentota bacterium]
MIDTQLKRRGIVEPRVLEAMGSIPRECFVPDDLKSHAYDDRPLEIGHGQTISQPFMVALMTQLAHVKPDDTALEIGTGSGYQCAVLARLARRVVSIERVPELASRSAGLLQTLGFNNVEVQVGDGTLGWQESAPYDVIIVTAAGPRIPAALRNQLREGGRLICPVGGRESQELLCITKIGQTFRQEYSTGCVFVPLIGADGWDLTE